MIGGRFVAMVSCCSAINEGQSQLFLQHLSTNYATDVADWCAEQNETGGTQCAGATLCLAGLWNWKAQLELNQQNNSRSKRDCSTQYEPNQRVFGLFRFGVRAILRSGIRYLVRHCRCHFRTQN